VPYFGDSSKFPRYRKVRVLFSRVVEAIHYLSEGAVVGGCTYREKPAHAELARLLFPLCG